jgi:PAS domain S-box-containing protein
MQENKNPETLANIAKTINALMCIISPEGYFTYLNEYWTTLLGWTPNEIKAKPFVDFIHPDDIEISLDAATKISKENESINLFRNRYLKKEGNYLWIEWKAVPGENGQIIATGQDVTHRALTEQQNDTSLKLLEQLGSIDQIGYWSLDVIEKEVHWSEQIYNIHGVSPDEYTPDLESAITFYHHDDVDELRSLIDAALKGTTGWEFCSRIIRPSGEIRHVISKAEISRDTNGDPLSIFGVFQDVTDRETLSERIKLLSQVAENTIAGAVIADGFSRVIWINSAFTDISGYHLDEIQGHTLGKFLHGDETSKETIEEIHRNLEEKQNVDVEILNYRKDGSSYWINLLISPVISDTGKLTHFIGFQQDITEKKKQEQERLLADSQRREAMNQLASGICHDFNNVLAVVMGNIELIEVRNTSNNAAQIQNIKIALERAQSVTQKLLKISRKSEPTNAVLVDFDEEIKGICSMLKETIPSNIELKTHLNTNSFARVNKGDLIDSVINLIVNAKHSIPHHGQIDVSTEITLGYKIQGHYVVAIPQNADAFIKLTIRDDGCGILLTDFQRVFTPFYSTRTDNIGTGLGLSQLTNFIVREKFGLTLYSEIGKGTEISIYLPLKEDSNVLASDQVIAGPVTLLGLKIVLIDDESMLLELNKNLLSLAGAIVCAFENPQEALGYIQQHSHEINIVITDHFMPGGILGSDIVNIVNDMYSHIPCIILTGNPMDINLKAIGGKVLAKPIKFEELKLEVFESLKFNSTQH